MDLLDEFILVQVKTGSLQSVSCCEDVQRPTLTSCHHPPSKLFSGIFEESGGPG